MFEWMVLPFKRYADFSGRSRRMEYWWFMLLNIVIYSVLGGLMLVGGLPLLEAMADPAVANDPSAVMANGPGPLFWVGFGLLVLYGLGILIPSIAVVVRRLHDRDMSGWWYLGVIVLSAIPFIGFIASIALFILTVLPGTPGPNRFGPDPKDPTSAEVFA